MRSEHTSDSGSKNWNIFRSNYRNHQLSADDYVRRREAWPKAARKTCRQREHVEHDNNDGPKDDVHTQIVFAFQTGENSAQNYIK